MDIYTDIAFPLRLQCCVSMVRGDTLTIDFGDRNLKAYTYVADRSVTLSPDNIKDMVEWYIMERHPERFNELVRAIDSLV